MLLAVCEMAFQRFAGEHTPPFQLAAGPAHGYAADLRTRVNARLGRAIAALTLPTRWSKRTYFLSIPAASNSFTYLSASDLMVWSNFSGVLKTGTAPSVSHVF
jgi:hypothetical protein